MLQILYANLPSAVTREAQEIQTVVFQQGTVNCVFTAKRNASSFLTSIFKSRVFFSLYSIFIGS